MLDTPVTIAPGDAGIVTYRLQTNPVPTPPVVAGVQMASFDYGTDEQIAAILDAAAAGTIDLQRDAGWKVGDQRVLRIAAFTAGGNVVEPAQNVAIVITSFEEYMGCGNVMQFDFACALSSYGAFPSSQTVETVTDNKLALRSEVEVSGSNPQSPAGEGTQAEYYSGGRYFRSKPLGISGSNIQWWMRSAYNGTSYCTGTSSADTNYDTASTKNGLAAFGCL